MLELQAVGFRVYMGLEFGREDIRYSESPIPFNQGTYLKL